MDKQKAQKIMEWLNTPYDPKEAAEKAKAKREKIWKICTDGLVEQWAREIAARQVKMDSRHEAVIKTDGESARLEFRCQDGTIGCDFETTVIARTVDGYPEYGMTEEEWEQELIERNINRINDIIYQYGVEQPDIID